MRRLSSVSTASMNSSVVRKGWSGRMRMARSLVIFPDSTVSTQTFSSVSANFTGETSPTTFANNDGWHDDVSDGPVHATVKIDGKTFDADGAWVLREVALALGVEEPFAAELLLQPL